MTFKVIVTLEAKHLVTIDHNSLLSGLLVGPHVIVRTTLELDAIGYFLGGSKYFSEVFS